MIAKRILLGAVLATALLSAWLFAEPITRNTRFSITVAMTTSATTTEVITYDQYAGGGVLIPTGSTITTLTWHASADGTTFAAASDEGGTAIVQTVSAAKAYELPSALYGWRYIKAVTNAAGTVYISLKT